MNKEDKSRGWKKYVAPKRDYKGWISLAIGACAVWIAYQSFLFQKNQSNDENIEKSTESSIDGSINKEAQLSGQNSDNSNHSVSHQSKVESNSNSNSNSSGTEETKNDPIETATKIYEGYKKLDIDPKKFKRNKDQ